MFRHAKLKRFAKSKLDDLKREFPVYDWKETTDPIKLNAIYPENEWAIESPSQNLSENQDWLHLFLCDPSANSRLEIFIERLEGQVAVAWVKLKFNDRNLVLKEALYKDNSGGSSYSAGGIRLECTAAMRFWRLSINAIFQDTEKDEGQEGVHVRIGGRLAMIGHSFEIPKQLSPSFVARKYETIDDVEAAKSQITKCCKELQAYFQPNSMMTEITIDGEVTETILFGARLKFRGNSDVFEDNRLVIGYAENGSVFGVIESTDGKCYGFNNNAFKSIESFRKGRFGSSALLNDHLPSTITFDIAGDLHSISLEASTASSVSTLHATGLDMWNLEEVKGTFSRREKTYKMNGSAFKIRKAYNLPGSKIELCNLLQFPSKDNKSLVLSTGDPECKNPAKTGGKGSSLAVLNELSSHLKTFTVPSAIVLTTDAYELFASTEKAKKAIDEFLRNSKETDIHGLKKASEGCVAVLNTAALPDEIAQKIVEHLTNQFGSDWETKKFAVRSSAVGEDSEEMSAAGQMTTFLGMKTKQQICEAVVKCWASQFSLTAVNYKRQYGQELNSLMAVVIQEMVDAEAAGVMFTCDPVTSNPACVFITANFGLGESVVSATADPDTYSFRKTKSKAVLDSKNLGGKDKIIVQSENDNGTEEQSVDSEKAKRFCLSDQKASEIASIGIQLSDITDTPRDIEWAVVGERVFLLQSRPVTSFLKESEFEIRNDINSGMITNREILSRANLDEVMPGAFSPLGISIVNHILFESFSKTSMAEFGAKGDMSQFTNHNSLSIGKKIYMNFSTSPFANDEVFMKGSAITMFGYDISKHEAILKGATHHEKQKASLSVLRAYLNYLSATTIKKAVKDGKRIAAETRVVLPEKADSMTLLLSILSQVHKAAGALGLLMITSMPSSLYNIMVLNVLTSSQGEKENTPDMMVLLSKLLRSHYEVESARIPKELTALSEAIKQDKISSKFPDLSTEDALEYLQNDEGEAAKKFREIRAKNAHRCYKEFDLHSKTWDVDPTPLIKTLQMNVRQGEIEEKKEDEFMKVSQLPKRPTFMQRRMLNFLIPRAKLSVYARESTKSALIKCYHQLRLALRRLGKQMFTEGRIPDPELVFFFTCSELHRVIKTRDPVLVTRAIRRLKMHPVLNQQIFPILLYGLPKPITSTVVIEGDTIKGVPVSEGCIEGPARVILDFLTEAHTIEKGDILVTRATDTGWTPYFPLLGGVITEVGGLLSHGAVVAREYGLPAVVGVQGATGFLKSGDRVVLDGNKGIITKVSKLDQKDD